MKQKTAVPLKNETRKENEDWEDCEKIAVLTGANTVGIGRWKMILDAHPEVFNKYGRTNVDVKDQYRTLVNQGLARLKDYPRDKDCFTKLARMTFNLKRGQQNPALMP